MGNFWGYQDWNCRDCEKRMNCIETRPEIMEFDFDEFGRCEEFDFSESSGSVKVTTSAGSLIRTSLGRSKILSVNARKDCVNFVEKVREKYLI
jgi:hypothetical protein